VSTYYYLVCNDCEEYIDAASRAAGGPCHLANSEWTLPPFIVAHSYHDIEIISEHDARLDHWQYKEWTKNNVDEMYKKRG
jgi:hypothetical protein